MLTLLFSYPSLFRKEEVVIRGVKEETKEIFLLWLMLPSSPLVLWRLWWHYQGNINSSKTNWPMSVLSDPAPESKAGDLLWTCHNCGILFLESHLIVQPQRLKDDSTTCLRTETFLTHFLWHVSSQLIDPVLVIVLLLWRDTMTKATPVF